jgi:hypothetical protein
LHKTFSLFSILTISVILVAVAVTSLNLIGIHQQLSAQSPVDNNGELKDFIARGNISSVIYTVSGNWYASGNWDLIVSDGKVTAFNTNMVFVNGTAGHTHEFQNFKANDDNVGLGSDQNLSIDGTIDVGTNGVVTWFDVPVSIDIQQGRIITISVDDKDTNNHFGDQSIHGTVTTIQQCNLIPGPQMQIPTNSCT